MQNNKLMTATNIIIGITIFMYIIQISIPNGSIYMGFNIYFIEGSFWWQPLSTMFTHHGIGHLLMNMFVLYQFGNLIEEHKGKATLLSLYFIGGLLTSLLSFAYMDVFNAYANLGGASGAISVLFGYVALVDKYQRKGIFMWIMIISFAPLLIGLPVAWYAHLIGFVLGWLMGMIKR